MVDHAFSGLSREVLLHLAAQPLITRITRIYQRDTASIANPVTVAINELATRYGLSYPLAFDRYI